jgi:hypothetical protein
MQRLLSLVSGLLVLALVGCEAEVVQPAGKSESIPAGVFVAEAPAGAIDVVAAKASAKDGQSVVIKGLVGGQKEPLAANRAIMTVADLSLPTCDKSPMDKCATPWDACCEPKDVISAKTLSVQVVDGAGQPLKAGLAGAGGLAPLKHVVVAGTLKSTTGDAIVVHAGKIYVAP